jgi:hypothetical protein
MLRAVRFGGLCLCVCAAAGSAMAEGYLGPQPYLAFDDVDAGTAQSPWRDGSFSWFHLEDFEDGVLNTPGVDLLEAASIGGLAVVFSDSVDGDDGAIDGIATNTRSLFSAFRTESFTFEFDAAVLGRLPNHVGVVWTDVGRNNGGTPFAADLIDNVEFEAWGPGGVSLGVFGPFSLGDTSISRTTAEDRFLGIVSAGGIARVQLRMPGLNNWEMDHLQYGLSCTADLNADGIVDFGDVSLFVAGFTAQDALSDLNGDGIVDFGDVALFVGAFSLGC